MVYSCQKERKNNSLEIYCAITSDIRIKIITHLKSWLFKIFRLKCSSLALISLWGIKIIITEFHAGLTWSGTMTICRDWSPNVICLHMIEAYGSVGMAPPPPPPHPRIESGVPTVCSFSITWTILSWEKDTLSISGIGYHWHLQNTPPFPGFLRKSFSNKLQKIPPFLTKWEHACGPLCIRVGGLGGGGGGWMTWNGIYCCYSIGLFYIKVCTVCTLSWMASWWPLFSTMNTGPLVYDRIMFLSKAYE